MQGSYKPFKCTETKCQLPKISASSLEDVTSITIFGLYYGDIYLVQILGYYGEIYIVQLF